jgi:hypothetical protein
LGKTVRLTNVSALGTCKSFRPPQEFKVSCACRIIGEYPLKFRKRRRETTGIHGRNLASECLIGNKPDRQGMIMPFPLLALIPAIFSGLAGGATTVAAASVAGAVTGGATGAALSAIGTAAGIAAGTTATVASVSTTVGAIGTAAAVTNTAAKSLRDISRQNDYRLLN